MHRPGLLSPIGVRLIGAYKLLKAALVVTAGVVVIRHRNDDVAAGLVRLAGRFRVGPDNHLVHATAERLARLDAFHLELIGVALLAYSLLYVAQGVGLILQKRWGEHLVVGTTGLLIPFEIYELFEKVSLPRAGVLLSNVLILAYLTARLRKERSAGAAPAGLETRRVPAENGGGPGRAAGTAAGPLEPRQHA